MTMRYAAFHPEYSDAAVYFEPVAERFGLAASGNSEVTAAEAMVAP